jgi:hypothetical protein
MNAVFVKEMELEYIVIVLDMLLIVKVFAVVPLQKMYVVYATVVV